ncbi:MAG: UDP-N-acetylmuramoyl-L-alanine--D-glutamate ligase [Clostridia bacterium]|nr:UDP-N-acetylmuramoyl-L-alanine--D-glutamate ligase [Clostridia bacterium]
MNHKLAAFFEHIKGREISVIGIGVSNRPLISLLASHGANVTACDKKSAEELGAAAEELAAMGVALSLGEGYLDNLSGDLIFKTPGMRFDHPALEKARANGATVTSEMEVFFALCPCRIAAVTGSDGKSTTTTLVAELLKAAGYTVHLGGNLGRPLLPDIEQIRPQDFAVLELSSFQLHTMSQSPDIAVITNLAPNHLDWHPDMAEYVEAKTNIFRHQNGGNLLVLNADNDVTASFIGEQKGTLRTFGRGDGCFLRANAAGDILMGETLLLRREEILLRGSHNVENYMAAIAAVWDLVPVDAIRAVAGSFTGLEHRLEPVRELHGVRYVNDSIASSPSRTMACLDSFTEPLILLLGGYDKHIPFDTLGEALTEKARAVVLVGATAPAIEAAIRKAPQYREGRPLILHANDMEGAVKTAQQAAAPGDIVVLSPACASFDLYRNFAHRGQCFKDCVAALT